MTPCSDVVGTNVSEIMLPPSSGWSEWGLDRNSDLSLQDCDALWWCGRIPRFRRSCYLHLQGEVSGAWTEIQILVFRIVTPCGDVVGYQGFGGHATSMNVQCQPRTP